jgi:hypothetical protein
MFLAALSERDAFQRLFPTALSNGSFQQVAEGLGVAALLAVGGAMGDQVSMPVHSF